MENQKEMTAREFYNTIIESNINDVITNYAKNQIEKLDKANEKRKNAPKKVNEENIPYIEAVKNTLTHEYKIASVITQEVSDAMNEEVKIQKVSAILRKLVLDGIVVSTDVKVPKKGQVKAYALAE